MGKDINDEEELQGRIDSAVEKGVAAALKAMELARQAEADKQAAIDAEVERRLEAERAKATKAEAASRRLPFNGQAPHQTQFNDVSRYDNLDFGDQAFMVMTLQAAKEGGRSKGGASAEAIKALVIKAAEDQTSAGIVARRAIKAMVPDLDLNALKANELNRPDLASYGDEWAAQGWSNRLWEKVRLESKVTARMPTVEIPEGEESITIPIDGSSVTFYKIAGATDLNATTGRPNATIPSSKKGTANKTITTSRLAARVVWDGAIEEDSIIPWVPMLRSDMEKEGTEVVESALIDGDTATAATTNINDIGNLGAQVGTEYYLMFDGLRKLALVLNSANSRDAGVLAVEDVLETVKLMGPAGINALDTSKVAIIPDPNVYYKLLTLAQLSTRDVFSNPTIEGGKLTSLYGYEMITSANQCRKSDNRLSNTAGKVDQTTPANNTKGTLTSVRFDQWLMGWKRRATMEITRFANADSNELVVIMRLGLIYRDTEASAVSYNITV